MMIGRRQGIWCKSAVALLAIVGVFASEIGDVRAESPLLPTAESSRPDSTTENLRTLISDALHGEASVQEVAIQELRKCGQDAVNELMSQPELRKSPRWATLLDTVAQQKDAEYSGLYWHTDLNQAIAAAKRERKPILSLRLLGKLTDELSCANSRFFRTTLYPNPSVRDLLAKQFVLHWQSVRAVPIITIDFGDGRKIERTITGNSLHLVLDENGRLLDALPGLYAAGAFCRQLQSSRSVALESAPLSDDAFFQQRKEFHSAALKALRQSWSDCFQITILSAELLVGIDHPSDIWTRLSGSVNGTGPVLEGDARRAVIERAPPAEVAGRLALTKSISETPTMRMVRNVSRIINEDSVRNEYYLHATIHNWFAAENSSSIQGDTEPLVNRIYSDLFLSPLNDPWYGLSKPDVFSAIKNDGRIHAVTQNSGR